MARNLKRANKRFKFKRKFKLKPAYRQAGAKNPLEIELALAFELYSIYVMVAAAPR